MRFAAFAAVADLPLTSPFLKVALIKWCYVQSPKNGYCPVPEQGKLKKLSDEVLVATEDILRYFHIDTAEHLDTLTSFERVQFLGNVDSAVAGAVLSAPKGLADNELMSAVQKALQPLLERLSKTWPEMDTVTPPKFCTLVDSSSSSSGKPVLSVDKILPTVIRYDQHGKPLEAQTSLAMNSAKQEEVIPYMEWASAATTQSRLFNSEAFAAAVAASLAIHASNQAPLPVIMKRISGRVSLVATETLKPGELFIPLVLESTRDLVSKSEHPHAVDITFKVTDQEGNARSTTVVANPSLNLPGTPKDGDALNWTGKHNSFLFWSVERDDKTELCNCDFQLLPVALVTVASFNQVPGLAETAAPKSVTAQISLPVITNTHEIAPNERLVVLLARKRIVTTQKTRMRTWQTDVTAKGQPKKKNKTSD